MTIVSVKSPITVGSLKKDYSKSKMATVFVISEAYLLNEKR